jgi:hypothetical protein
VDRREILRFAQHDGDSRAAVSIAAVLTTIFFAVARILAWKSADMKASGTWKQEQRGTGVAQRFEGMLRC